MVTQTDTHKEYMALLAEVCAKEPQAFRWASQAIECALTWDHIVDRDPVTSEEVHATFETLMLDWVFNDWFIKNRLSLVPVLSNLVANWKLAPNEGSKESYAPYLDLPLTVCLLTGGRASVAAYAPRFKEIVDRERKEDMRRDTPPFLILALPRSRTAWLSAFLSHGDVRCHHELLRNCEDASRYVTRLLTTKEPIVGDADPSLVLHYAALKANLPAHKLVFVIRDEAQAKEAYLESLREAGEAALPCVISFDETWETIVTAFNAVRKANPDSMTFEFENLNKVTEMSKLVEYCTGRPMDVSRFLAFDELKITAHAGKVIANQRIIK